ncbi:MAG TPA: hypothetical protein VFC84_09265 [Desulfosporosinus sp.]|nr:hypothetical protein [Desulfosporosinus sp.]
MGHWTDQTARTGMCGLPVGSPACRQFSGTLLYILYHRCRIIGLVFDILEGNERKRWKYLEVNYLVSGQAVLT